MGLCVPEREKQKAVLPIRLESATEYLVGEGLLDDKTLNSLFIITHAGIKEIEEAVRSPDVKTKHFSPINILHIQNMHGSQLQVGTTGSKQTMNITNNADVNHALLKILEVAQKQAHVTQDQIALIESHVDLLKTQAALAPESRDKTQIEKTWTLLSRTMTLIKIAELVHTYSTPVRLFFGIPG